MFEISKDYTVNRQHYLKEKISSVLSSIKLSIRSDSHGNHEEKGLSTKNVPIMTHYL